MHTSEQTDKLITALQKAQASLTPALKDSTNPHFKSKYADLSSVWEACRKPLADNGLVVLQDVGLGERGVTVTTRIAHTSGQWMDFGPLTLPLAKQDAQGVGSCISYGRRYAMSAALGVIADDDDGNAAVGGGSHRGNERAYDRQAAADPTQGKNPPGISAVKVEVRELMREIHACSDWEELLALINDRKPLFVKCATVFKNEWTGPDGTGLRGETMKVATTLGNPKAMEAWLLKCEAAKPPVIETPKVAAE